MNADEIEVFLALADELHFTRTAQRLHLPQPRVSKLIASLERQVGGALFMRTSRRVTLTPLGARLRDQAGPHYAGLQSALDDARDYARGIDGVLRVGYTITVGGPSLSRLVEEFCARHPGCEVILHQLETWAPYGDLRQGHVDVMLNWQAADEPHFVTGPVIEYRERVLAVSRRHRLAGRQSVSVEDLGDEETEELPGSYPAALADAISPRFTPSGRQIRHTHHSHSPEDVISLIARGRIVHPTMAGVSLFLRDDIRLITIRDMPLMPLGLIWRAADENARIRALAAAARRLAQRQPGQRVAPSAISDVAHEYCT